MLLAVLVDSAAESQHPLWPEALQRWSCCMLLPCLHMLDNQLLGLQVLELSVGLGIPAKQSWAETFVGDPVPDSHGFLRSH